jgi:exonuclease III
LISLAHNGGILNKDLLNRHGVHPNPGPEPELTKQNLSLITYNCRGLRKRNKLRSLLANVSKLVKKGAIVSLQETHAIDESFLKLYWKEKSLLNCNSPDQKGVVLLFNSSYTVEKVLNDNKDRFIIAKLKSDLLSLIVGNIYCPNNTNENIKFLEEVYQNISSFAHESPESSIILMGDMNLCLNDNDSLNRQQSPAEARLAKIVINSNKSLNLLDAGRKIVDSGGYTWMRGICFSRLDYIFVSEVLSRHIVNCKQDWALSSSDHAAVVVGLTIPEDTRTGPGISKLNTFLLNDPIRTKQIDENLKIMLNQIPEDWNPHTKLEYMKVVIRSVFSEVAGKHNKETKSNELFIEEELNQLISLKQKLIENDLVEDTEKDRRVGNLETAIAQIRSKVQDKQNKDSESLAFKAKVKWFELGEKSNKYFLGLLKMRQNQKFISNIICEGTFYEGFEKASEAIRTFYNKLYDYVPTTSTPQDESDFFKHCPKLTNNQRLLVDNPITLPELTSALKSCKESAPGPDGISYLVYKKYWETLAPYILDAWNYSLKIGSMSSSNIESIITLLPKQGKDTSDIKNWRPITLSNCDSKIITKAIATRVSKVLDTIIDNSQTAYVPTRSVMDNIRSNFILKNHCSKRSIDAVLISLDAKKAFDSVSHDYIRKVLRNYGFGENFVRSFDTLYNNLKSSIMINGFKSNHINIRRGVKQGDALSCALFILSIDPLIRNIKNNETIEGVSIATSTNRTQTVFKVSGYADDIAIICKAQHNSISKVFNEYEKLTKASGLELNADKTEILNLNKNSDRHNQLFNIKYMGKFYELHTTTNLKICGLNYSTDLKLEYKENITNKIEKLEGNLKKWMVRNLSLEGKILIVKTFGLSQMIYNLQCYQILKSDLIRIERLIFKFLWSKKWKEQRPIERIKRSILKNNVESGGLNAPDIECLDRSLKLKQFLRSNTSNHPIKHFQAILLENNKYKKVLNQEYCRLVEEDPIINSSQTSINKLTDHDRERDYGGMEGALISKIAIDLASSIKIEEYLKRKNQVFIYCNYYPLKSQSILSLHDILFEKETSHNSLNNIKINNTLSVFNKNILQLAEQFNEDYNTDDPDEIFFLNEKLVFRNAYSLSVKDLQRLLKISLKKIETLNIAERNKLTDVEFEMSNIVRFRNQCKDAKSRNVFYRLINNDFFFAERMFKYGMTTTPNCSRCNEVETSNHLLFDCRFSKKMWSIYNEIIKNDFKSTFAITKKEDIFNFDTGMIENRLKIKLINELIQIERPTYWTKNKVTSILLEMKSIDKYSTLKNNLSIETFNKKWR